MQRTACGQVLLVITIALLAANLVTMLVVNTAAPANAQAGRTCVGGHAECERRPHRLQGLE